MATGYTADVADGKVSDFRIFALRCARAFGATVTQRDDPAEEFPRLGEVADYYRTSLVEKEADLAELDAMSIDEVNHAATRDYENAVRRWGEAARRNAERRNRYNAMMAAVIGWTPPTHEHTRLKEFMVEQLTSGRDFDCDYILEEPVRLSGASWLAQQKQEAQRALLHARRSLADAQERVEEANAWISALYASLPAATRSSPPEGS